MGGVRVSRPNGRAKAEQLRKQREEEREAKKDMQAEQGALQNAFNKNGNLSQGFIQEIVSKKGLEVGAPDGVDNDNVVHTRTVAKLQNMLSRDWVLGNITEAQEHDARHKLEVLKLKVLGTYPPEESAIQGDVRAFLMDNPEENQTALTAQEQILIDELIETLKTRIGRGRGGFERKQENTSISRAETDTDPEEEQGGWGGLFS